MNRLDFTPGEEDFSLSFRTMQQYNCRHMHQAFEILYLFEGERTFFINHRTLKIDAGNILIINSNVLHWAVNTTEVRNDGLLMYLYKQEDFFGLDFLFQSDFLYLNLDIAERVQVEESFLTIRSELEKEYRGYEMFVRGELLKLLVRVNRMAELKGTELPEHRNARDAQVSEIVQYLNQAFREPLTVQSIAENFLISSSYICRIFKEVTGYRLTEYINFLRVKEAKRKLLETGQKILDISLDCGFGSVAHFGRVFRKITGKSPREYRYSLKGQGG